jgi:hypothetical protein
VFRKNFKVSGRVCDLRIHEFGQGSDELRRGVEVGGQAFFVDVLPDCVPEGGFEALGLSQTEGTLRRRIGGMSLLRALQRRPCLVVVGGQDGKVVGVGDATRRAGPRSWAARVQDGGLRHFNSAGCDFVLITFPPKYTLSTRTCDHARRSNTNFFIDYDHDELYVTTTRASDTTPAQPLHTPTPIMDYVDWAIENLGVAKDRLVDNSIKSFEGMTPQRWVRIIVIIGGYMLLRPFLLGFAAKRQKKQFEQEAEELGLERDAGPNANSLRGGKKTAGPGKVLGEVKEDEDWGNKAKTRQRKKEAGSN